MTRVDENEDLPPDHLLPREVKKVRQQFGTIEQVENAFKYLNAFGLVGSVLKRFGIVCLVTIGSIYGIHTYFPWVIGVLIRVLELFEPVQK